MKKQIEKLPQAPAELSARSRKDWDGVVRTWAKSPGRLVALEECLRIRDRADQATDIVVECKLRALFVRSWTRCNFHFCYIDGRIQD
jgi:hypothetical protein